MIARMKKMSVLLYHRERDAFVNAIQDLGAVHVEEKMEAASGELSSLSAELKYYEQVALTFQHRIKQEKIKKLVLIKTERSASEVATEFMELDKDRQKHELRLAALEKDKAVLTVWGEFDPVILDRLHRVGVKTRFFEIAQKKWEEAKVKVPALEPVTTLAGKVLCVLFEQGEGSAVDGDEVKLPTTSLSTCNDLIREVTQELVEVNGKLDKMLPYAELINKQVEVMKAKVAFEAARLSFNNEVEGHMLHLEGWIPAKREKETRACVDKFKAVAIFENPSPGDTPPVWMQNGPYSRLFEPITKLFSLPDYFELDPTPFFAPFFMLFVGLCLGDLAYGSIIFLVALPE